MHMVVTTADGGRDNEIMGYRDVRYGGGAVEKCNRNARTRKREAWKHYARFLDAFGLDVPACEVVLEHADEAFFGVVAVLRAVARKRRCGAGGT